MPESLRIGMTSRRGSAGPMTSRDAPSRAVNIASKTLRSPVSDTANAVRVSSVSPDGSDMHLLFVPCGNYGRRRDAQREHALYQRAENICRIVRCGLRHVEGLSRSIAAAMMV